MNATPYTYTDRRFETTEPVVQISNRWFISFGHAGFNLVENNGFGWATEQDAMQAHRQLAAAATRETVVSLASYRAGLVQWEAGR